MIMGRRATTYGCHVDLSSRLGHAASEWSLFSAGVSLDGYRRSEVYMAESELMNISQCSQVPEACRDSSRESGLGSCPKAEKAVHRAATNRASLEDGVSDPANDPTCLTLQARWLWRKVARGVSLVAQAFVCDSGGWVSTDDKSMRLQGEGYWHPHLQASKKLVIRAKTLK